ncbi:DNA invertase Pin-like site-specific DNA recombinase [Chitinophaga sp. W3I9]|uniref:master DNA invertase Mpi family serine-type recombinase n=1 Tax=Chitinophaga sp. W3I9 TaxID=3373924 RepID=UPI003D1C1869
MVYAYVRVSTDKQTNENQRFEIKRFASQRKINISKWVEETISSRKNLNERAFGVLLRKLKQDDILIVSEISRMGRNLMQIMSILNICMERQVKVFAIKEGYELGDNINSKVLAFAFGLSAEIERTLISQRIKESLARLKSEGRTLGRPTGSKKRFPKLAPHDGYIRKRLAEGAKQIEIARALKVHRHTLKDWIDQNNLLA